MSNTIVSPNDAVSEQVSNEAQVAETQVQDENGEETTLGEAIETSDTGSSVSTVEDDNGEQHTKPKKGFEKRISKVVSERDRARQELEYWKQQALQQKQYETPQEPVYQPQVGKPAREMFNTDEQYFEALSDWKVEQRLQEREMLNQQRKLVETYQTRAQEFAKERPDFFDIINDAQDLIVAPETGYIIQKSEVGPRIALYLAENAEENDRLNTLDATTRIYELGKLEAKLTASQSKAKPAEVRKISNAPAPLQPVKGAAPKQKDLYDPSLTTAEWIALRSKRR
jgi:hypothetical protein